MEKLEIYIKSNKEEYTILMQYPNHNKIIKSRWTYYNVKTCTIDAIKELVKYIRPDEYETTVYVSTWSAIEPIIDEDGRISLAYNPKTTQQMMVLKALIINKKLNLIFKKLPKMYFQDKVYQT